MEYVKLHLPTRKKEKNSTNSAFTFFIFGLPSSVPTTFEDEKVC